MRRFIYGLDVRNPAACARALREKGYDTVVSGCTRAEVIAEVRAQGLDYVFCGGAFSLEKTPHRAVDCEGAERTWFGSGCPTDEGMRLRRLDWYRRMAEIPGVSAVWIDGARFASFASAEGCESFFTCFCPDCMRKMREAGLDAEAVRESAVRFLRFTRGEKDDPRAVLGGLTDWLRFREASVCSFLRAFSKTIHEKGLPCGAFVFAPSLAKWVGQARADQCGLDVLSPMLYRRYPEKHGPACLNHEWAALMRLMTEHTGLSREQAQKLLCAPKSAGVDILANGFDPAQIGAETAMTGGNCLLAPILQRQDDLLNESIRAAEDAGADAVGLFAFDTIENTPTLRAGREI